MDESIALTSIGRDGERSDLVTNAKKPEIFVYDGTIIATAEKLLFPGGNLSDSGNDAQKNGMNSGISREILDTTGMPTPMGEVIILRACSDGFIQLAGSVNDGAACAGLKNGCLSSARQRSLSMVPQPKIACNAGCQ